MKHDYMRSGDVDAGDRFADWLEAETTSGLHSTRGDVETTRGVIFLFVNRAFEAHMPEERLAGVFGRSVVKAGYSEAEEEALFDVLEFLAEIARRVHAAKP